MAILQKKIELDHLEKYNIKNDVLDYIAANVKSNIRELEGSLNKLIALYKLNNNNNPIDIALAAEALKDIISSDNRREVTPELILDIVADHFGITVADLKSKKRDSEIAVPRQICMYLMRTMTDTALKGIGAVLGGKDHSTVKYGVEKIAKDIESDEMMANTINIIKKKINPAQDFPYSYPQFIHIIHIFGYLCGYYVDSAWKILRFIWIWCGEVIFCPFFQKATKMFSKAVPHIFQFNFTDLSKRETPEFTGRARVFLLSTAPKANKTEKIYLFLYMRNVGKEFYTYDNRM